MGMDKFTVSTCWQGDLHFGTRGIGQNARYGFTHGGCGALGLEIMDLMPDADFTFCIVGNELDDWSHVVLTHPSRPFEVFDVNGWTDHYEMLAQYRAYNYILPVEDEWDIREVVNDCVPQNEEAVRIMALRVIKKYLSPDPVFYPHLTMLLASNKIAV